MRRTRFLAGVASAFVVAGVLSPATSTAATVSPASPAESAGTTTPAHAVAFRTSMGLRVDAERLADAEKARNAGESTFGVPLTDAEYQELALRQTVVEDDVAVVRSAVTDRLGERGLAGVWMDNRGGGRLTVGVTRDVVGVEQALAGRVHHPERLAVRQMSTSLVELESIAGRVRDLATAGAVGVSSIAVDERANVVRVRTAGDVPRVERLLASSLADTSDVVVEQAEATPVGTQYTNSPPFRGGQEISSDAGYICTSGFIARNSAGDRFIVTAGHCGKTWDIWTQVTMFAGLGNKSDVTGTDAMDIVIDTAYGTNEVTLSYHPDLSTTSYREITSSQDSANDAVGQVTCITGRNFVGLRCGEILSRSFDVSTSTHDGRTLSYTNGREADVDCNPGDSGGPALYGNQARGIISVKVTRTLGNDTCVYAHIEPALNQLGLVDVLTQPGGLV